MDGEAASRSSDLYSVGCLLYELLTGARPFDSCDQLIEIRRRRSERPGPMPGVPSDLAELTVQLLAEDPSGRPADARAVHEHLTRWIGDLASIPGWVHPDLSVDPIHLYIDTVSNLK